MRKKKENDDRNRCDMWRSGVLQALLDSGVIPGSDMTVEAALMKLAYILSKNEWSLEKKRKVRDVTFSADVFRKNPAFKTSGIFIVDL